MTPEDKALKRIERRLLDIYIYAREAKLGQRKATLRDIKALAKDALEDIDHAHKGEK